MVNSQTKIPSPRKLSNPGEDLLDNILMISKGHIVIILPYSHVLKVYFNITSLFLVFLFILFPDCYIQFFRFVFCFLLSDPVSLHVSNSLFHQSFIAKLYPQIFSYFAPS